MSSLRAVVWRASVFVVCTCALVEGSVENLLLVSIGVDVVCARTQNDGNLWANNFNQLSEQRTRIKLLNFLLDM